MARVCCAALALVVAVSALGSPLEASTSGDEVRGVRAVILQGETRALLFQGRMYAPLSASAATELKNLGFPKDKADAHTAHHEELIPYGTPEFWMYSLLCLVLVCTAGAMSGLTVGFFSIDPMRLDILRHSRSEADRADRERANTVEPVLADHHKLLVTLLLTNAAAMEALPIFLDKLVPTWLAIILSVTFVLFFGEVIPQAFCTKNALAIGATMVPVVKALMCLELPVTWPIAKLLDIILGHDTKHYLFKRADLATLIEFHSTHKGGDLQEVDEVRVMKGALRLRDTPVRAAMTPYKRIYTLDASTVLDAEAMSEIMATGYSRIPVFRGPKQNIVGMLLIKRLILIDPEDSTPVAHVLARKPLIVEETMDLYELLNLFQSKHCHMAIVTRNKEMARELQDCVGDDEKDVPESCELRGLITIEDVIEELIQEEIWDETDTSDEDLRIHRIVQRAAAKWRQFVKRRKEERKRGSTGVPQPSEPLHKIIDKHGVAGAAQRLIAHNRSDVSAALVQRGLHKAHKLNSKARRRTISRRVTRALSSAYRDVVARRRALESVRSEGSDGHYGDRKERISLRLLASGSDQREGALQDYGSLSTRS